MQEEPKNPVPHSLHTFPVIHQGHFSCRVPCSCTSDGNGGILELSFSFRPRITWAHDHAGVPLLFDLILSSPRPDVEISGLEIAVGIDGDLCQPFSGPLPPFRDRFVTPAIDLRFHAFKLQQLVESMSTRLRVTLRHGADSLGDTHVPITLLAANEFDPSGLPELVACFVTPNAEAVQSLLVSVRDLLVKRTGDPVLDGYRRQSRSRVRETVESVYQAISLLGVTYAPLPASFETHGQKIRFPAQVIRHAMGNCLDLSLLYAAGLEQAGLHPVLILGTSHAMPGCWLVEDWHEIPVLEEAETVRKLIAAGDLLVLEATAGISSPAQGLAEAMEAAASRLGEPDFFRSLIDIKAARLARFLPLPVGGPLPVSVNGSDSEQSNVTSRVTLHPPSGTAGEPGAERPPATAAPSPQPLPPEFQRLAGWKEKLLDLSNRNRMLNYRPSRSWTVSLAIADLASFEDRLASGQPLCFKPLESEIAGSTDGVRARELLDPRTLEPFLELLREQLQRGFLFARLSGTDLRRKLQLIVRRARTEIEESGVSTLFIALGMLQWTDAPGEKPRHAPLLLYPVQIRRHETPGEYSLFLRSDEPRLNEALLEKLRRSFQLDFPELRHLPLDESGIDTARFLESMRRLIARRPGFEVIETAVLDFFSFTKFLMWRDLDCHQESLLKNDLVRHLANPIRSNPFSEVRFAEAREIDQIMPPGSPPLILDADSSQQVAIAAALAGHSYILQGPPGTGKSQTIANLLAACLFAGKKVLFVAEKQVALEVVARRLEARGLGSFLLELHSHKAERGAIARELAQALSRPLPPLLSQTELDERLQRLSADRAALNGYVDRVHAITPLGMSLFEIVGRLTELHEKTASVLQQRFSQPESITSEGLEAMRQHLALYASAARELPSPVDHPLSACRPTDWSKSSQEYWRTRLESLARQTASLIEAGRSASRCLGIEAELPLDALAGVSRLLKLVAGRISSGVWSILQSPEAPSLIERIERLALLSRERFSLQEKLESQYDPRLVEQDLEGLKTLFLQYRDRNFLARWWNLRAAKSLLCSLARGPLPDDEPLLQALELAMKIKRLNTMLVTEHQSLQAHLGPSALQIIMDPVEMETLSAFLTTSTESRSTLQTYGILLGIPIALRDVGTPPGDLAIRLKQDLEAFHQGFDEIRRLWRIKPERAFGARVEQTTPERIGIALQAWLDAWPKLYTWSRFILAEDRVLEDGFDVLVDAVRAGTVHAEDIPATGEREFLEAWVRSSVASSPELRSFGLNEQEQKVSRFREDDRQMIATAGQVITNRLAQQRPDGSVLASEASEVGILQREARKKTGHLSVRRLFEQIPHLLGRIKPCLLMSPLSIAQYLPASREPFDLVVFDEASQITVYDAIGAIARGRQVIVVGDSRQLPPTTFFTIGTEDAESDSAHGDEEAFVQDLESILDECVAAGLPSLLLRWHYRSRDERLIAFSNIHSYDSQLSTFPSAFPPSAECGVSLIEVEGVFERGGSRTNQAEVEAICAWVVEALRHPQRRQRSLGIVTFNQPQQMAIEDRLEALRREHPEIDLYFTERVPEPVFIKNIENVQGDERDVMLFSITYGPDHQGTVGMNFGPLNRVGGERRLNVAVTRARDQLVVFSSLKPEAIDLSRTRSVGVEHLRNFLRYAAQGPSTLPQQIRQADAGKAAPRAGQDPESTTLQKALAAAGYIVQRGVGCSSYRLDLAVQAGDGDPLAQGFILGIETDGPAYRSGATVRDRDRLRNEVLAGLGWNLHRVWLPDWWRNPEESINRILRHLREAGATSREEFPLVGANATIQSAPEAHQDAVPATLAPAPPAPAAQIPPYQAFPIETVGTPESFQGAKSKASLEDLLERIIVREAPIHLEECCLRAALCFGFKRLGTKIRERIEERLTELVKQERAFCHGPFVWRNREEVADWKQVRGPAVDGTVRKPEHIPPEETAAAAILVLRGSIALPRGLLAREAAILTGFRRPSEGVLAVFQGGIDQLLEKRVCHQSGEQIHLN